MLKDNMYTYFHEARIPSDRSSLDSDGQSRALGGRMSSATSSSPLASMIAAKHKQNFGCRTSRLQPLERKVPRMSLKTRRHRPLTTSSDTHSDLRRVPFGKTESKLFRCPIEVYRDKSTLRIAQLISYAISRLL